TALGRFGHTWPAVRIHLTFSRRGPGSTATATSVPPQAPVVTTYRLPFAIWLLGCLMLAGSANAFAMPSPIDAEDMPAAFGAVSGSIRLGEAQPAPATPPTPAPAATPA